MMSEDRKESSIVVKSIVSWLVEGEHEKIQAFAEKQGHEGYELRANEAYALMENGDMYIIDDDGVGNDIPMRPGQENVIKIGIFAKDKPNENGSFGFSIAPFGQFGLSYEDILALETEDVPLHDHIRKFGHRLESNYNTWVKKLSEYKEKAHV
jgi:hypothetical protein